MGMFNTNEAQCENDMGFLEGKWKLKEFSPENCTTLENCNADFMLLKMEKSHVKDDPAFVYEIYERLADKEDSKCGTFATELTHTGTTWWTDKFMYRINNDDKLLERKGTPWKLMRTDNEDIFQKSVNKKEKCFEIWERYVSKQSKEAQSKRRETTEKKGKPTKKKKKQKERVEFKD